MQEEIDVLHAQDTWFLVSLLLDKNLVGCKLLYSIRGIQMVLLLDTRLDLLQRDIVKKVVLPIGRHLVLWLNPPLSDSF